MAKIKYTNIPNYPTVEIVGKTTSGSVFGTVARRECGRCFITEEAGFDPTAENGKKMMVNGDENVLIQTVDKAAEMELFVRLAGDIKSTASFKFFDAYVAKNRENAGCTDVFVKNCSEVDELVKCAKRMCEIHPEASDRWEIVNAEGKRCFIRVIAPVNDNGAIEG